MSVRRQVTQSLVIMVCILISSGVLAREQTTPADNGSSAAVAYPRLSEPSRAQAVRIRSARTDLESLERKVSNARRKLVALQLDALPPNVRAEHRDILSLQIASMIGGNLVFPGLGETVGFELGDVVVFTRPNERGRLEITGIGTVQVLDIDSMQILVTKMGKGGAAPRPEDVAYIISRDDSPYSLAKHSL